LDKKTKTNKKNKLTKKTETNQKREIDIHCACAMGDLSEFAQVKPAIKTETKIQKKDLKKDSSKKESNNK
jgi:hypothetical protein